MWILWWRSLSWLASIFLYALSRLKDALAGDKSDKQKGRRLRELFERVGGTGTKIGQQMAMRVDFLPYEVCQELEKLLDASKPFPLELAIQTIEASLGRPVSEIFAEIEPEPIGSASIACVWSATLLNGERVAVKVRRPKVERGFIADIELVAKFTRMLETISVIRPGFLENLRNEMRDMFMDELDFVQEANYQIMFRRMAKKAKLRWVSVPKVYVEYSSEIVLTSQFVTGYLATDVLKALEENDLEMLRELKSKNIDIEKIGKRVLALGYWSRLESFFFHSDLHPGNVFILPGSKIALIDFGSCGVNYSFMAEAEFEGTRRMLMDDIPGAINASLLMQMPLPGIDVERLGRNINRVFFKRYVDLKSKQAEWWERTSASLWIAMMDITKEFDIPANINTLRFIRSSLLYDTLAFRFNPSLDFLKTFRDWTKDARKRGMRERRKLTRQAGNVAAARTIQNVGNLQETLERGAFWANQFLNTVPTQMAATASQASYIFSRLLKLGMTYSFALLLCVMAVFLYLALFQDLSLENYQETVFASVTDLIDSPIFIVAALVYLMHSLGQIQNKLREKR
ncbi:ABC-1 domain protein [Haliangium ochraceum DSM 14365]|nr:ABC-1 domain protein [Haliangium ochraceum DSM 14365]